LRRQGISVLRFWEHEVAGSLNACVSKTRKRLMRRRHQLLRSDENRQ
jgi:very-short-patch-repair endonuclease